MGYLITGLLVWLALGGAFTCGCWWASKHDERKIEAAFKEGWESGRDWERAHDGTD